jgi:hypothetical protein
MKSINYIVSIIAFMLLSISVVQATFNDDGTDYTDEVVEGWIDMGPAMDPLNFTDFLTCLMSASKTSTIVNGTYTALADATKCEVGESSEKPEIVTMTITTSRLDNDSPQNVSIWYDAGNNEQFIVEVIMTEGATESSPALLDDVPYGSFTFNWQNRAIPNMKGSMSFTHDKDVTSIKLYNVDYCPECLLGKGREEIQWINGAVKNNRTTGQAAVGIDNDSYVLSYNNEAGGFVNIQKTGATAECSDRDDLAEYVHGYNLYDQLTGTKKQLNGPFSCTYDSDGTTKECYVGQWGGWFEGGEETTTITSVTHEDGRVFDGITHDSDDSGEVSGIASDGKYIEIPGYSFDPPLIFDKADQVAAVQTAMANSGGLQYYGPRALNGIPWLCSTDGGATYIQDDYNGNCDESRDWRPSAKLADGTVLNDNTSTPYVIKAKVTEKVMEDATGFCDDLPLTGVSDTYPALTADFVTAVTKTWDDKPVVSGAPKVTVVNGVNGVIKPNGIVIPLP